MPYYSKIFMMLYVLNTTVFINTISINIQFLHKKYFILYNIDSTK